MTIFLTFFGGVKIHFFSCFFVTFLTLFGPPFWGPKSDIFDPPGGKKVKKTSKSAKNAIFPVNFPLKSTHPPQNVMKITKMDHFWTPFLH